MRRMICILVLSLLFAVSLTELANSHIDPIQPTVQCNCTDPWGRDGRKPCIQCVCTPQQCYWTVPGFE